MDSSDAAAIVSRLLGGTAANRAGAAGASGSASGSAGEAAGGSVGRSCDAMGKMWLNRSNGCWLDVFDAERFGGNARRLHGPADFPGLRIREKDWGEHIASLSVGPAAYVQCYASANFDDTVYWLLPNQVIEAVEDVGHTDRVDSIRLYDRPPFAHEAGYAAYMLWAASHLASLKGSQD